MPTLAVLAAVGGLATTGLVVTMVGLGLAMLPLGKYFLLADRLLWVPYFGAPVELRHAAIKPDGVRTIRRESGVVIEAAERLALPVVTSPLGLAALLALYARGPLRGVNAPPSGTALILPASLPHGTTARPIAVQGHALLHLEGVCFLPAGSAPLLLRRLTDIQIHVAVSEQFVLEQLSRLDPQRLSAALRAADQIPGAFYRDATQVEAERTGTPTQSLRLKVDVAQLEVWIGAVDYQAVRSLFPWTQDQKRQVP